MGDGRGFRGLLSKSIQAGRKPDQRKRVDELECSDGFTMCNVSIQGATAEQLGLTAANVWYQPCMEDQEKGIFQMCEDFFDAPEDHPAPMMLTFPSMKDTGWVSAAPGNELKHTAQILILTKNKWFQDKDGWIDGAEMNSSNPPVRSSQYSHYKERWGREGLEVLYKLFPKLAALDAQGNVDVSVDVSTPLSIKHYLFKSRGQATGLDSAPERYSNGKVADELNMKCAGIDGLWLTGQDTLLCGQPLVQISGVITALRIAGIVHACKFGLSALRHILYRCARG